MARLPQPGGDSGDWGTILNDYLSQTHLSDGKLKPGIVTSNNIAPNAINETALGVSGGADGQVLTKDSAANTGLSWKTITGSGSTPDATSTVKGVVQLSGDLGGTASSPTVPALATKQDTIATGTTSQYYRGDKSWATLDKSAVGLSNVDNTSDANKPVSTATQTALTNKANDTAVVHNTDDETVAGIKTFSSSPIVPTPTTGTQAANKTYVDNQIASGTAPDATTSSKGIIQLSGDLAGTATAPTVPGLANKLDSSQKGAASGVASLDSASKVTLSQLSGVAALATNGGSESVSSITSTSTTTLNLANGNVFNVSLNVPTTTFAFTGATNGRACSFTVYLHQSSSGNNAVSWPTGTLWAGGAPTLTTTANAVDIVVFESIDGGTTWFGSLVGNDFKV